MNKTKLIREYGDAPLMALGMPLYENPNTQYLGAGIVGASMIWSAVDEFLIAERNKQFDRNGTVFNNLYNLFEQTCIPIALRIGRNFALGSSSSAIVHGADSMTVTNTPFDFVLAAPFETLRLYLNQPVKNYENNQKTEGNTPNERHFN